MQPSPSADTAGPVEPSVLRRTTSPPRVRRRPGRRSRLGTRDECSERLREVAADLGSDLWAERVCGRARDLHAIRDARTGGIDLLDPMRRSHDDLAQISLVDEEFRLPSLCETKLDRLITNRGHQDCAAGCEGADQLDALDVAVPCGPSGDIRPELPNLFRRRPRLHAVLVRPHRVTS